MEECTCKDSTLEIIKSFLVDEKRRDYSMACEDFNHVFKSGSDFNNTEIKWLTYELPEHHVNMWTNVRFLAILKTDAMAIELAQLIEDAQKCFDDNSVVSSHATVHQRIFKAFDSQKSMNRCVGISAVLLSIIA